MRRPATPLVSGRSCLSQLKWLLSGRGRAVTCAGRGSGEEEVWRPRSQKMVRGRVSGDQDPLGAVGTGWGWGTRSAAVSPAGSIWLSVPPAAAWDPEAPSGPCAATRPGAEPSLGSSACSPASPSCAVTAGGSRGPGLSKGCLRGRNCLSPQHRPEFSKWMRSRISNPQPCLALSSAGYRSKISSFRPAFQPQLLSSRHSYYLSY